MVGEEEPGDVYELLVPESTAGAVAVVAVEVAAVGIGGGGGGVLAVAGEVVDPVNIARMDTICTSGYRYAVMRAPYRINQ